MPLSAWIMFLLGCLVLYGGLALCIGIAIRKRNKQDRVTAGKNARIVDQRRDT
ncbi:MAG: MetS family NSS transporter small subunit [Sedimentisphaerales bacterium]